MTISSHCKFWHLFPPVVLSGIMVIKNQKNKACIIVSGNAHRSKDTTYKYKIHVRCSCTFHIYMVPFLEVSQAYLPVPAVGLCPPLSTLGHQIQPVKRSALENTSVGWTSNIDDYQMLQPSVYSSRHLLLHVIIKLFIPKFH